MQLAWTAPTDDGTLTGYIVHFSTIGNIENETDFSTATVFSQSWTPAAQGSPESQTLMGLLPGVTYYWSVKAFDDTSSTASWSRALGENPSNFSPAQDLAPSPPLNPGTGISQSFAIDLNWSLPSPDPGDLEFFRIYRATESVTDPPDPMQLVATILSPGTTHQDTGLSNATTYYYRLTAVDTGPNVRTSTFSAQVSTQTSDVVAPTGISNLTALNGTLDGEIQLSWTAPGDDENSGALRSGSLFRIRYSSVTRVDASNFDSPPADVFTVNVATFGVSPGTAVGRLMTGLIPGASYWFAIKTADGEGNFSVWNSSHDVSTVNTAAWGPAQDVTPAMPTGENAVSGNKLLDLSWTANSEPDINLYEIYRSTYSNAQGYSLLVSILHPGTTHQDVGLLNGNTYYYQLQTVDATSHSSVFSSSTSAFPLVSLSQPVLTGFSQAVSTISINWAWSDVANEDGYRVISATSGDTLSGDLSANTTFWIQTDLTANTSYVVYVQVFSDFLTSDSASMTRYTWANIPAGFSAPDKSTSSLSLAWQANSNPPGTRYELQDSPDGVSGWAILTSLLTSTTHQETGLAENASYYYRLRALNGDSTLTNYTAVLTTSTAHILPGGVVDLFASVGSDDGEVDLIWTAVGDDGSLGIVNSYVLKYATFDVTSANFGGAGVSEYVQAWTSLISGGSPESRSLSGLNPGTTYYFAIKGVDEVPSPGPWSTSGVNTFRLAPARDLQPPAPASLSAVTGDHQVSLSWNAVTGEPDLDLYRIYRDSTSPYDFSDALLIGTTPQAFIAYTDAALVNETTYAYRISVIDQGPSGDFYSPARESAFSNSVTTRTLDTEPPAAITNLSAQQGPVEGEILISWTSPGDDALMKNIVGGRLRIDNTTNPAYTFSTGTFLIDVTTTVVPLSMQSLILSGLTPGDTYYIRTWLLDEVGNSASLSNGATTYAQMDVTPPDTINDLATTIGWRAITLSWTAPGDDGSANTLNGSYAIRWSTSSAVNTFSAWNASSLEVSLSTSVTPGITVGHTVTGLTNGQAYWFAVRAQDESGNVSDTSVNSPTGTPINSAPAAFNLISPTNGTVISTNTPTLTWSASSDVDTALGDVLTYTVEYSTDPTFSLTFTTVVTGLTSPTLTPLALTEDISTYWRVRALDLENQGPLATNGPFSVSANTSNSAPGAFNLISPSSGAVVSTLTPTLDWADSTDTDPGDTVTYTLEYSTDLAFSSPTTATGLSSSAFTFSTSLQEDQTYFWRVTAEDGITSTLSNQIFSFSLNATETVPSAFNLTSPSDGVRITTTLPILQWQTSSDPDPQDNVTYTLTYSNFANFATSTSLSGLTTTSFTPSTSSPLIDNLFYYWFVTASDPKGNKRTTSTRQFDIDVQKETVSPFSLLVPTSAAILTEFTPFFDWTNALDNDPADTVRYLFDLSASDPTFAGIQPIPTATDSFFQTIAPLTNNTTYYWRVTAGGYQGTPPVLMDTATFVTPTQSFIVKVENNPPGTFDLLSPADSSQVSITTPTFTWEISIENDVNDFVTYTISISSHSDFSASTTISGLSTTDYTVAPPLLEDRDYFWKVTAIDLEGVETVSISTFQFSIPILNVPEAPAGLKGQMSSDRVNYTLIWGAVTKNTNGSAVTELAVYSIYKSLFPDQIGEDPPVVQLSTDTLTWTDTINGGSLYYAVRTVDTSGIESANSVIIQSGDNPTFIALAQDKGLQIIMEPAAADLLFSETNGLGEDARVSLERKTQDEVGRVIRSYDVQIFGAESQTVVQTDHFPKPVTLGFAVTAGSFAPAYRAAGAPSLPVKEMSVFWFNGVEYIKLGGQYQSSQGLLTLSTDRTGSFQLQRALRASSLEMVTVWPRKIFTPNGDGINDEINIVLDNPKQVPLTGEIYDLLGAKVADLTLGTNGSALVWNGKDSSGETVINGVYIYQIRGDGKILNGTVVVAR